MTRAIIGECGDCRATFKGKQNHCKVCHQTFSTENVGDKHRTGPYNPPGQRRCLTDDELRGKGLAIGVDGVWREIGGYTWGRT